MCILGHFCTSYCSDDVCMYDVHTHISLGLRSSYILHKRYMHTYPSAYDIRVYYMRLYAYISNATCIHFLGLRSSYILHKAMCICAYLGTSVLLTALTMYVCMMYIHTFPWAYDLRIYYINAICIHILRPTIFVYIT